MASYFSERRRYRERTGEYWALRAAATPASSDLPRAGACACASLRLAAERTRARMRGWGWPYTWLVAVDPAMQPIVPHPSELLEPGGAHQCTAERKAQRRVVRGELRNLYDALAGVEELTSDAAIRNLHSRVLRACVDTSLWVPIRKEVAGLLCASVSAPSAITRGLLLAGDAQPLIDLCLLRAIAIASNVEVDLVARVRGVRDWATQTLVLEGSCLAQRGGSGEQEVGDAP